MMIISTMNSTYKIEPVGDSFAVTKISADNPLSMCISVGETRLTKSIHIQIGTCAEFDGWHTSRVLSVGRTV